MTTHTTPLPGDMETKLAHIEKCLDWSTVKKYNDAIVALAYIEEIRRGHARI